MQDNKEIIDKAVSALNRPVKIISITTRDQINHLINQSYDFDKFCKDFIVSYREIETLFKSKQKNPNAFNLNIVNYSELEEWAKNNNLKVDFLIGTEKLSLRPIHFQIL